MKLKLLSASLIFGAASAAFGQNLVFTQNNEPAIGESRTMLKFEVNNHATYQNLTRINETGNTWDYSGANITTTISNFEVQDVSSHPTHAANFSSASKYLRFDTVDNFIASTGSSRVSHGYVYTGLLGTDPVAINLINGGQTLMNYPFADGNSLTSNITGDLTATYMGFPVNATFTGTGSVRYAGENGTLRLPNGAVISDVSRVIYVDSLSGTTVAGPTTFKRFIVEYYVEAQGNLPILVENCALLFLGGGTSPSMTAQSIEIDGAYLSYANVGNVDLFNLNIAPNPSNGVITVNGDFVDATVNVVDVQGKLISTQNMSGGSSLTINSGAGVYFVSISTEKGTQTQKVVIK